MADGDAVDEAGQDFAGRDGSAQSVVEGGGDFRDVRWEFRGVHVQADADDDVGWAGFDEDAGDFAAVDPEVIGPFDLGFDAEAFGGFGDGESGGEGEAGPEGFGFLGADEDRKGESFIG